MRVTLDPKQIDVATKELIKKQQKEIAKLKKQVDSLRDDLQQRKYKDAEVARMKDKFERAKSAIVDMLDIQVNDGQMGL